MRGRPAREDVLQPAQRLSESQEARLKKWILRQEALGFAPSHTAFRTMAEGLLKQQGDSPPLGKNWVTAFLSRHPDVKSKKGRRIEASRFNGFTPLAVKWFFDIRESEYAWIKPELTHNVDKGGIMASFRAFFILISLSESKSNPS
jgi:hypothetical protein